MKRIGLIVNPVAGMGGSVGLKGTDGKMYRTAIELGAEAVTPARTRVFLSHLKHEDELFLLTAPGKMGENVARDAGINFATVSSLPGKTTSADDTRRIGLEMSEKVDLLVFVGGDGTARDIYDAVGLKTPVIGVPSGVKMFGSVFAVNAIAAAEIVDAFIEGNTSISEKEVLDINEEAYREGRLESKLYGYLKVPEVMGLVQSGKEATISSESSQENQAEIARYIIEGMVGDTLYLLGAGTTTTAIAEGLEVKKTLLGVDAVYNNRLVAENLNEKKILELLKDLQQKHGLAYLFISHDLRVIRSLASYIFVMQNGKVVEHGTAEAIFENPKEEYTKALMAAAFELEASGGAAMKT